jgi:hypothetical protein
MIIKYKNSGLIILISLVVACGATSTETTIKKPDFEVTQTLLITDTDTLTMNELRFYQIISAKDAIHMMHKLYGPSHKSIVGKHQNNIQREIWENITLFENNKAKFTVIADGTETRSNYYACLMIFDKNGRNCFVPEHPYYQRLVSLFSSYMKTKNHKS